LSSTKVWHTSNLSLPNFESWNPRCPANDILFAFITADSVVKTVSLLHFGVQAFRRVETRFPVIWRTVWRPALVLLAMLTIVGAAPAQQEKPKVPGLDKIIAANEHLMFTGTVKLLDEEHNSLSVSSVEGSDTEIFPIKHSTRVLTSDGFRKKLNVLTPGTQIIVYYDQRSDRRSITQIELYTSETKKKEPHS
jgi:hypothetical protein